MVLPSDRIIPFLGGGPLLRSSTLPVNQGFIVALGGAPFELVIASDVSVSFLQVTTDPASRISGSREDRVARERAPRCSRLPAFDPPMPARVIVLGGGVGGMSAAHELIERGFEVVVLERRDIAGGKARSIPVERRRRRHQRP